MGLIEASTPSEKSAEYIKAEIKGAIQHLEGAVISSYQKFVEYHTAMANAVDPNTVIGVVATPQEILDEFGTSAVALIDAFTAATALVNLVTPNKISLQSLDITKNEDGTATINQE